MASEQLLEHGISGISSLPDVCVTTWQGELTIDLTRADTATAGWTGTDGAPWPVEVDYETAG